MLSVQQQKVVDIHRITPKRIESGGFVFLIAGREVRQTPSLTSEGAVKKGIGYIMSRYRK